MELFSRDVGRQIGANPAFKPDRMRAASSCRVALLHSLAAPGRTVPLGDNH